MAKVLVTGGAGFIGMFTTLELLKQGFDVVSIDNLNDYYDVNLKEARLAEVAEVAIMNDYDYMHVDMDLADKASLAELFKEERFDYVCNLAAQAGVRYSIENPQAYIDSNIQGFINILECCRDNPVKHLVYASSSSVYGKNETYPYTETDFVDNPVSLYAATKKSNELMAHVYSHLYQIPTTGLRFFTVYGPWGRPDMAYYKFTKMILEGKTIDVYNHGDLARDFTYIDDIVTGVVETLKAIPESKDGQPAYEVYNIGNNQPVKLLDFIETLESVIGKVADKNMMPMQQGDVYATHANIDKLKSAVGFAPNTSLKEGLEKFYEWYQEFYQLT